MTDQLTLPSGWFPGSPAGVQQLTSRDNLKWNKVFGRHQVLVSFDAFQDGFVVYRASEEPRKKQVSKWTWVRDEQAPEFDDPIAAMIWLEIRGDGQ